MSKPRVVNDPEAYARTEDRRKLKADQLKTDVAEIMSTGAGKRYFKLLLERAMVFRTTFTGNSQTYFNEGMRNFGLTLLNDISISAPETLPLMLQPMTTEENDG